MAPAPTVTLESDIGPNHFVADHDHVVNADLRFVQLTPPGSACSINIGIGITDAIPGP
jgi:hypothetical protein